VNMPGARTRGRCRAVRSLAEKERAGRLTDDSVGGGAAAADTEQAGVEALRAELEQEHDRHLRTRADYESYRRRVDRDRDVAVRHAKRELLLSLTDLADGFDRALLHVDESPDSVIAGLYGMRRCLSSLLEAEGVTSFDSVGQRFDPTRHEAMSTARVAGGVPGTVVHQAGPGYLWNDQLLRPARVRVAE
jgi:molecular chaperone GrpE